MYSVPPWPSLAASMAAYRLRSFSESESWNIRIECSISGLYVMAGVRGEVVMVLATVIRCRQGESGSYRIGDP